MRGGNERFRVRIALVNKKTDRGVLGQQAVKGFEWASTTWGELWAGPGGSGPIAGQVLRKLAAPRQIKKIASHGRSARLDTVAALAGETGEIPGRYCHKPPPQVRPHCNGTEGASQARNIHRVPRLCQPC